jgi:hypothetical protein
VDARADAPEHFRDRRRAKFCNRIYRRFVMAIYEMIAGKR